VGTKRFAADGCEFVGLTGDSIIGVETEGDQGDENDRVGARLAVLRNQPAFDLQINLGGENLDAGGNADQGRNLESFQRADEGQNKDREQDRKSTRLNSSHEWISYAVFCLKNKNNTGGFNASVAVN